MAKTLLIAALLPLMACSIASGDHNEGADTAPGVTPQGSGSTRTYPIADFTRIEARGSEQIDVRVGPGFSVRADGAPELLDHLRISKVGDALRIDHDRRTRWSWKGDRAKIAITLPQLAAIASAGSGSITVDRVQGRQFSSENAGSGSLAIGDLSVDAASFDVAGSGDVRAKGQVRALKIAVAGSGDIDAGGVTASEADVSVAGSGNVRARVNGAAKVSVMGSGDVDLGSGARCSTSKLGSGSVRCGG